MTQQKLAELLREKGVRVTSRRLAIAEAFLNPTTSSVQQIYELVYGRFPSVTMAGIYSTLGVLRESGLIGGLSFQNRFSDEANLESRVELVCIQCGDVAHTSIGQDSVLRLRDQISHQSNFQVSRQEVGFYGWCSRCTDNKKRPKGGRSLTEEKIDVR